jgi:Fe-S cluster biogenesis protein NfuA
MASPLAKRIFAIDGVTNVFFGIDFVTVSIKEGVDWATVKPQTFEALMDFYASGAPVMDEEALESHGTTINEDDDEIVAMIKELLETRIRPAVAEDGGDIVFKKFDPESGLVTVQLQGSCDGCPSSSVTLKSGIENMLMHYVPEVKGVVQGSGEEEELDLLDLADLHRGRK